MDSLEITTMSSRGQIVIPQNIRDELGLNSGIKFLVIGEGDTIILKRLEAPSMHELKTLLTRSRTLSKKSKMKKSVVDGLIAKERKKS